MKTKNRGVQTRKAHPLSVHGHLIPNFVYDPIIDPITGLVAFPCFFKKLPSVIPHLLNKYGGFGLAIGDVDHLKSYVEDINATDPMMFGHLAGNLYMSNLGKISLSVFNQFVFPWSCLSTFGGDKIIFVCAGTDRDQFRDFVKHLHQEVAKQLPRTISFATGWFSKSQDVGDVILQQAEANQLCISAISMIDRALLMKKKKRKEYESFIFEENTKWLRNNQWSNHE